MLRATIKTYLIIIIVVILVGGILGYTYNRTENLIHGPRITVDFPQNGATLTESGITLTGRAQNTSKLLLNERVIFIDEEGRLSERFLLSEGYNKLVFTGYDRFGRITQNTVELVYKH